MEECKPVMDFSAEAIEKVVYQFYFVPSNQVEAHGWLTVAQESPEAWKFCWELMQPDKSQEVQFFGANTLCAKLSKFWSELTEAQYEELKVKLIRHVIMYISQGPKIILTRLCVALSHFIIRTIPSYWTDAIADLISILHPDNLAGIPAEKSSSVTLLILTLLTEEFHTIVLCATFRSLVRIQLHSNTDRVLTLIQQTLMNSTDVSLNLHALKCFHKWIMFGISMPDSTKLVDLVFNFITVKEYSESGCDILQSIIFHPDSAKYPDSVLKLLDKILQLENVLTVAVQEKDTETCLALCGLYTALGESHVRFFLEAFLKDETARENFLKLVKIILACTGAPGQYPTDETFSYITFAFWYNLQDEIISADKKNAIIYRSYFTSIFESLVDVLLQKLMSPKIKNPAWTADEIEQFRCYREDIGDTFMYCYNLLRSKMLERLLSHLNAVLLRTDADKDDTDQALEACLSAFQSIADSVDTEENNFVPQFLSQLLNIPYQNKPHLLACIIDALGAFAEWINCNPNALPQVIPLILFGLNKSGASASSATLALSDISRDCQLNMKPYAESILAVCEDVFIKRLLKHHEEIRLMYSVGYLGSLLTPDILMNYLKKLLMPVFLEMQDLSQKEELTAAEQATLIWRLKILSTLFNTLNLKLRDETEEGNKETVTQKKEEKVLMMQPVLLILEEFLPVLKNIVIRWPLCSPLTDAVCDLLKRAVTNLLDDVAPALESILQFVSAIYSALPSVAALNLFKTIALMFFENEEQKILVQNCLVLIVNTTLAVSQQGGLSNHSDVCDGFCQLIANLFKKLPTCVHHEQINLLLVFQYGIAVLSIPETPAVKAASMLLVNFINQSRDYPNLLNVINNYGDVLLTQIFTCIGGMSPRGVMDSLTDVLSAMVKKYSDNTTRWLHSMPQKENFPSNNISKEQKAAFVSRVLKDYSNKRKIQEHVKIFSLICRGVIGTQYGSEILPCL